MTHEPQFLTLAEILYFHDYQIKRFGGEQGIRDEGLLESAIAQPRAGFGGRWLHPTLYDMAAAYAFHICKNHPFLDGNKRTSMVAALVFLDTNGISIQDPKEQLPEAIERIAKGEMNKAEFAGLLRELSIEV